MTHDVPGRVVVVGASIGGVRTVQALRGLGFDGAITLVGEEGHAPYDRPPLSKAVLAGASDVPPLCKPTELDDLDVDVRLGRRATRLRVADRAVELDDGSEVAYDDVVVATGSRARPSPWGTPAGSHVLRTADDAAALRADLVRALGAGRGRLVVIGGGLIGSEVAATANTLGLDVTIVDPQPAPAARVLGPDLGAVLVGLHERHGVRTRLGTGVTGVTGADPGARLHVALTDGDVLPADVVVVGIGALPNDEWLRDSGLLVRDGVVCDESCRAVDAPSVHAVGDVARWPHQRHGSEVRVEHWTNAVEQAAHVARGLATGEALPYAPVEYVWTDQHDWRVQVVGVPTDGVTHEIVGDPLADERFASLHADRDGALVGVVAVNWPKANVLARRAIPARTALADVRAAMGPAARP